MLVCPYCKTKLRQGGEGYFTCEALDRESTMLMCLLCLGLSRKEIGEFELEPVEKDAKKSPYAQYFFNLDRYHELKGKLKSTRTEEKELLEAVSKKRLSAVQGAGLVGNCRRLVESYQKLIDIYEKG